MAPLSGTSPLHIAYQCGLQGVSITPLQNNVAVAGWKELILLAGKSPEQCRKYQLTVNNPVEKGLTHEIIKDKLNTLNCDYWAMADEIGEQGTYHTHIYIYRRSAIRWRTIKKKFDTAHIEEAYGSSKQNRDYIRKEGKYAGTEKAETSVPGTFQESGELPNDDIPVSGTAKKEKLIALIEEGLSNAQILKIMPDYVFHNKDIDGIRQELNSEKYKTKIRELNVTYLYGAAGTGKTSSIYAMYSPKDIYRITSYRDGKGVIWDGYHGEKVVVFEEFHSDVCINEMLNYLDIYPLSLPARYNDKTACYDKVIITSNIALEEQYTNIQKEQPETYKALLRRIQNVVRFNFDGSYDVVKGCWKKPDLLEETEEKGDDNNVSN